MRKTRLIDLDPQWVLWDGTDAVQFDCPEANSGCEGRHTIPVAPQRDGSPGSGKYTTWSRTGDDFASMSITPSIRCWGACQWHGHITSGAVTFCDDSKSGPDWE